MNCRFSIKDLEKLSGIKAHTLRIWEQRYGILNPERTDTNIRWYCNDKLKHLLNVTFLYEHGYKISKIALLSPGQVVEEVNKIVDKEENVCDQIRGLVLSMIELEEDRFETIISNNINNHGFTYTVEKVVYPFLSKIGVMWQTGSINPAQEHFISNLIRQKLISAIDTQKAPANENCKRFILFLPDGELHELSLLYFNYLLKSQGHRVIYLGQSVPLRDLKKVVEIREPEFLISVFTHISGEPDSFIKELSETFHKTKIFLSGCQVVDKFDRLPSNVHAFCTPQDLLELVKFTTTSISAS
ncbi:MAG: MerR family transcriptional regulator [Bacteroidota bacterium]|jgi:DNA-binding transcriptional MerR regulator|nr:MerR family transcriptional regulator [Bacteroidota bacterium]